MTTPEATRGRAVRQPLPSPRARAAFDPRDGARLRRQRLLRRLIPLLAVILLVVFGVQRLGGPAAPAEPSEVAAEIRDQVTRDIIARTDDYSVTVGPLDCVELHPGKGNCLADVKLASHRADRVMVAVTYTDDGGDYDLVIKMP